MIPGSPQPMAKLQKLFGITCLVGKIKFMVNFYLRVHWLSESQTFLLGVLWEGPGCVSPLLSCPLYKIGYKRYNWADFNM